MKRFIVISVFLVVIVGIMLYFMPQSFDKTIAKYVPYDAVVTLYCRETSLDCIDTGIGKKVNCKLYDYYDTVLHCSQIDGYSVSFCGTETELKKIINKLEVDIKTVLKLDEMTVVCGVSNRIKNGVIIDGQYVNVQIAYKQGVITIGSPLILGDY